MPLPQPTIASIDSLPPSKFQGTEYVGVIITSGVPSYFKITGGNLDRIKSVNWLPKDPASLQFQTRNLILLDNTVGTFMIRVTDNYLDTTDRGGKLIFTLDNGTTLSAPVKTYGPISVMPIWTAPDQGLITG